MTIAAGLIFASGRIGGTGGTGAAAGGGPALAVHVPAEVPLAIAAEDVQRFREIGEEVVVIDLRPLDAFRRSHVAHAQSLPLGELRRRQAEIPRAGRVVLYSNTPEEAAAAYQALREAGHRNVMVLAGGFPAWLRLGLPVETGP
jgi:rhodanese-related sulfurtransferase